jgi:hypothetical protein
MIFFLILDPPDPSPFLVAFCLNRTTDPHQVQCNDAVEEAEIYSLMNLLLKFFSGQRLFAS